MRFVKAFFDLGKLRQMIVVINKSTQLAAAPGVRVAAVQKSLGEHHALPVRLALGGGLVAQALDDFRRGADEHQPRRFHRAGERGVLGQEAEARVDGLGAVAQALVHDEAGAVLGKKDVRGDSRIPGGASVGPAG